MRFARVISPYDQQNPTLAQLLGTADLDVLQLDYLWPHGSSSEGRYASGFLSQLRTLHQAMFLDPLLHGITNAGGGSPLGCVEAVAEFLCKSGSADLPLTLVRGSNLLPRLEEYLAAGMVFNEKVPYAPLKLTANQFVSAQVELGAGPLATALGEGSRLVIAGCYDTAAPAIAATVAVHRVPWEDVDALARVAVASHVPHRFLDIQPGGEVIVHQESVGAPRTFNELQGTDNAERIQHADVGCKVGKFLNGGPVPNEFRVEGIQGKATRGRWRLRLMTRENNQLLGTIPRDAIAVSVDTRPAHEWR